MRKEARPVGPGLERPVLVRRQAGGGEVAGPAVRIDGGDGAAVRAGERAGGVDPLLEHGVEVEARADAQDRRAERGRMPASVLPPCRFVAFGQGAVLLRNGPHRL